MKLGTSGVLGAGRLWSGTNIMDKIAAVVNENSHHNGRDI